MFLGIEIGGTKLQLGVASQPGSFEAFERRDVDSTLGADGIRNQIVEVGRSLCERFDIQRVGYGFGGPVDDGVVITSHQIDGWNNFPLRQWTSQQLNCPAIVGNDCDVAALAEATAGAGRGKGRVFYVTVGTGIGGGFVIDGCIQGANRPAASEIGHLRPGPTCTSSRDTVEAVASGWGIVAVARERFATAEPDDRNELLKRSGDIEQLTAKQIGESARAGNGFAIDVLNHSINVLGWAIAQVITLTSAEVVVVGGGVSLIGEQHFYAPLRSAVSQFVFPPLAQAYQLVPAALGEDVVVHGAIALAAADG